MMFSLVTRFELEKGWMEGVSAAAVDLYSAVTLTEHRLSPVELRISALPDGDCRAGLLADDWARKLCCGR